MTDLTHDLETMLDAYIECALWSSTTPEGCDECERYGSPCGGCEIPLDDVVSPWDLSEACAAQMRSDCADFLSYIETLGLDTSDISDEQMGHDFWLTRNGHGAGFWDRGLGKLGDALSDACKPFGSAYLWIDAAGEVQHD